MEARRKIMEIEEDSDYEELENLKEEKVVIDGSIGEVNEGFCEECGEKLIKIVENRNLLNGSLTFHIIELKCMKCGKEYLDLGQAEKYDFFLILEKAVQQPLERLSKKISA